MHLLVEIQQITKLYPLLKLSCKGVRSIHNLKNCIAIFRPGQEWRAIACARPHIRLIYVIFIWRTIIRRLKNCLSSLFFILNVNH